MSTKQDVLGSVVKALGNVPEEYLGLVEDFAHKLSGNHSNKWANEGKLFLRRDLTVSEPTRNWREQDGVIYLGVISDGTTGEQWIERLGKKGFRLSSYAKSVLQSKDFKPTKGIVYEIAILKGLLFSDNDRVTKKIRAEARHRKLTKPNAEVACLIREKFSDEGVEAMGLTWIVAMHEPIKDSDGDLGLLLARRDGVGWWLGACCGSPGSWWPRENGFAFAVSQVQSLVSAA